MPGWPLPAFSTASMASTRTVSTARRSRSDQFRVLGSLAATIGCAPRHGGAEPSLTDPIDRVRKRRARRISCRPRYADERTCRLEPVMPSAPHRRRVARAAHTAARSAVGRRADRSRRSRPCPTLRADAGRWQSVSMITERPAGDRPGSDRRAGGRGRRRPAATCGARRRGVRRADQAADRRAAAGHHRAGDDAGRRRPAVAVADRRGAGRRLARGRRGERAQLLHRPRHRPADAAHHAPPAARAHGVARAARWSSGWCSAVVVGRR